MREDHMPTIDWVTFGAQAQASSHEPAGPGDDAQERIARAISSLAARLETSEENFRTFIETIDDIIVVASLDGRILYANPALARKLGYGPVDLRSMRLLDLHPPEMRAEAESIYAEMGRGERASCPLPLVGKSGPLVAVETRVWLGTWNDERCIFGICKDLSAEQAALQKFDRLFRLNPSPMAVSAIPGREFTDVNDAWLELLGYERAEVVGRSSQDLGLFVDPETQTRVGDLLQATGRVSAVELQVRRKDGSVLDGLFSGDVIESQGSRFFLTVMVDQTEAKLAREALVRQARIHGTVERAIDATTRDLDRLLSDIGEAAGSLERALSPDDPRRATLGSIDEAARLSADLVARLADLGRTGSEG
jgi:PAS domain S-box-containing protein